MSNDGNNPFGTQAGFGAGPYGAGNMAVPPPQKSSSLPIILIILAVVLVFTLAACGILVALLLPAVQAARDAARRMSDQNSMKQVGLAMHNYHDVYNALPAPIVTNSEGTDVWSWRVSVLPYIEQGYIYDQIDFTDMRPWDDPKNAMLQGPAPMTYTSTRSLDPPGAGANIFMIVGERDPDDNFAFVPMFVKGEYTSFRDVTDGLSNTLMAIQLPGHSVPWASPGELSPDEAYELLQNEKNGFNALFGDGYVRFFPEVPDRATFDALVTRNGAEMVSLP